MSVDQGGITRIGGRLCQYKQINRRFFFHALLSRITWRTGDMYSSTSIAHVGDKTSFIFSSPTPSPSAPMYRRSIFCSYFVGSRTPEVTQTEGHPSFELLCSSSSSSSPVCLRCQPTGSSREEGFRSVAMIWIGENRLRPFYLVLVFFGRRAKPPNEQTATVLLFVSN